VSLPGDFVSVQWRIKLEAECHYHTLVIVLHRTKYFCWQVTEQKEYHVLE